jgi:phosphoribosylformylglycinamidine synthase
VNPRVAILRMEGTNNEQDMHRAFAQAGGDPEYVHVNQISERVPKRDRVDLADFDALAIPGGFSGGDYVRAGAIFAARLESACKREFEAFSDEGKPILGVCNGFQVLVELGLLPGGRLGGEPDAVLTMNESDRYECRPSLLEPQDSNCPYLDDYEPSDPVMFPTAHAEGRLLTADEDDLAELEANGQIAFRYTTPDGSEPDYPWNPNGSPGHVAGLTDPSGTVLGLMPHPDRVVHGWQHPDWTRGRDPQAPGDGRRLFENIVDHASR